MHWKFHKLRGCLDLYKKMGENELLVILDSKLAKGNIYSLLHSCGEFLFNTDHSHTQIFNNTILNTRS